MDNLRKKVENSVNAVNTLDAAINQETGQVPRARALH